MKALDFSKFKKIAEDAKTVTMAHPSGHEMVIMVSALPKIQREQIKMLPLAKGGEVTGVSTQGRDVRHAKKAKARGDTEMAKQSIDMAKEEAKGRADFERLAVKPKLKGLKDGGDPGQDETPDDQEQPQEKPAVNINVNAPSPDQNAVSQAPPAPVQAPPVQPVQNAINERGGLSNQAASTLQSQAQGQQAIQEQAGVDTALSKATAEAEQEKIQAEQQIARQNAAALKDINTHAAQFADYMKQNPINAKHYQENQSTGDKVGTAIGMFLGGFGTPFGGHNYAFDFLNKQIDRDVDAQKANAQNQATIYGAYEKLYNNSNVATALAKASSNDIMAHKINLAAAQLGTQKAAIAAKLATQKLGAESEQLRNNAAALVGSQMGPLSQNKTAPQGGAQKSAGNSEHILKPGSDEAFNRLQFNPLYKNSVGAIQEQKNKADLADKAIDAINETYPEMVKDSQSAGIGNTFRRKAHMLSGAPIIGPMIGGSADIMTNTEKNKSYDSYATRIKGAVRGALQGNVGEDLLDEVISKNTPEYGDSPDLIKQKLGTLKQFIKEHTKTDLLRAPGLSDQ